MRNRKLVLKLERDFSLGRGESEAVALAWQEKVRLVGVEDKRGINAGKLTGVPFTTAMAILLRSRQEGLIDRNDALARLSSLVARQTRTVQEFDSRRREAKAEGTIMTKTMSIRMVRDNYEFLSAISREERSGLSKPVRDLVTRGKVLLAIESREKARRRWARPPKWRVCL